MTIEIIGCILAMAGSWMSAGKTDGWRSRGFATYLVANTVLGVYAIMTQQWPFLAMYLYFVVTSLRGIRNNRA